MKFLDLVRCWESQHVVLANDLSYNGCFANNGSLNDVSSTMSVGLIVDSPTAILPNVCSLSEPLMKRAFIANLT